MYCRRAYENLIMKSGAKQVITFHNTSIWAATMSNTSPSLMNIKWVVNSKNTYGNGLLNWLPPLGVKTIIIHGGINPTPPLAIRHTIINFFFWTAPISVNHSYTFIEILKSWKSQNKIMKIFVLYICVFWNYFPLYHNNNFLTQNKK